MRTYFAYHLTHTFGEFDPGAYYTNSEKPRLDDRIYVVSGNDASSGGKDYWLEGSFSVVHRARGPFKLTARDGTTKSYEYELKLRALRRPPSPIAMSEFDWYERSEVHRFFSSGQNFNPMPTGYQARFDEVLAGFGDSDAASLTADLAEISEQDVPETMRVALGLARIGQGRFRANVMSLWGHGEQCALTGLALPELLVASHIKPWRESSNVERLDKWNGLLLAAHVDKLFDRYLMTFERRGGEFKCLLHTRARDVARKLGIADGVSSLNCSYLSSADVARIDAYLELHRSVFRTRIANERLARPT